MNRPGVREPLLGGGVVWGTLLSLFLIKDDTESPKKGSLFMSVSKPVVYFLALISTLLFYDFLKGFYC